MKIEGFVAIVTGGASGLGEATVQKLASLKCKVAIADLNEEAGNALVTKLGGKENAIFVKTDVSDEQAAEKLVEETVKAFGAVHIVVNSAGVLSVAPTVSSKGPAKAAEMLRTLKINVLGTFNVSKAAAYQMTKQKPIGEKEERGVIINVASVAGIEGQRGQVCYSASKGAIIGMTLPLARDLGKFGIRVMTIAPSIFKTPMAKDMNDQIEAFFKMLTPIGRIGDPPEFADAVVSLASNSFLTGEVVRLDGGLRLGHI